MPLLHGTGGNASRWWMERLKQLEPLMQLVDLPPGFRWTLLLRAASLSQARA